MGLIANKPCSFGGRKFYIGDVIPANVVADAKLQEKMGVITIVNDGMGVSGGQSGTLFTQGQVEGMIAEAVEEAVNNTVLEMEQKQKELQEAAGVLPDEGFLSEGAIIVPVRAESNGDDEQQVAVLATPGEIQQVFSVMQMGAEDAAKEIAETMSENVLILLHAADSRKTIKTAAKKRADNLFATERVLNGPSKGIEATGTNTEGADT